VNLSFCLLYLFYSKDREILIFAKSFLEKWKMCEISHFDLLNLRN
jgi:hypothetical protein